MIAEIKKSENNISNMFFVKAGKTDKNQKLDFFSNLFGLMKQVDGQDQQLRLNNSLENQMFGMNPVFPEEQTATPKEESNPQQLKLFNFHELVGKKQEIALQSVPLMADFGIQQISELPVSGSDKTDTGEQFLIQDISAINGHFIKINGETTFTESQSLLIPKNGETVIPENNLAIPNLDNQSVQQVPVEFLRNATGLDIQTLKNMGFELTEQETLVKLTPEQLAVLKHLQNEQLSKDPVISGNVTVNNKNISKNVVIESPDLPVEIKNASFPKTLEIPMEYKHRNEIKEENYSAFLSEQQIKGGRIVKTENSLYPNGQSFEKIVSEDAQNAKGLNPAVHISESRQMFLIKQNFLNSNQNTNTPKTAESTDGAPIAGEPSKVQTDQNVSRENIQVDQLYKHSSNRSKSVSFKMPESETNRNNGGITVKEMNGPEQKMVDTQRADIKENISNEKIAETQTTTEKKSENGHRFIKFNDVKTDSGPSEVKDDSGKSSTIKISSNPVETLAADKTASQKANGEMGGSEMKIADQKPDTANAGSGMEKQISVDNRNMQGFQKEIPDAANRKEADAGIVSKKNNSLKQEKISGSEVVPENVKKEAAPTGNVINNPVKNNESPLHPNIVKENRNIDEKNVTVKTQSFQQDNIKSEPVQQNKVPMESVSQEKAKTQFAQQDNIKTEEPVQQKDIRTESATQDNIKTKPIQRDGIETETVRQNTFKTAAKPETSAIDNNSGSNNKDTVMRAESNHPNNPNPEKIHQFKNPDIKAEPVVANIKTAEKLETPEKNLSENQPRTEKTIQQEKPVSQEKFLSAEKIIKEDKDISKEKNTLTDKDGIQEKETLAEKNAIPEKKIEPRFANFDKTPASGTKVKILSKNEISSSQKEIKTVFGKVENQPLVSKEKIDNQPVANFKSTENRDTTIRKISDSNKISIEQKEPNNFTATMKKPEVMNIQNHEIQQKTVNSENRKIDFGKVTETKIDSQEEKQGQSSNYSSDSNDSNGSNQSNDKNYHKALSEKNNSEKENFETKMKSKEVEKSARVAAMSQNNLSQRAATPVQENRPVGYTDIRDLIYKIERMVSNASINRLSNASFTIDGKEYGKIEIKLKQDTKEDQGVILVETQAAKDQIQKILPQIHENLQQKGSSITAINVEINNQKEGGESRFSGKQQRKKQSSFKNDYTVNIEKPGKTTRSYGYNTMEVLA
ncbi:MAG: flagellar hook-length control protein FliK [Candidatus Marinimicrobia bacterium]|nr:flagellar hook-length control protein FliK [Candidatus Neomarinimicrobiota bacterium]